MLPCFRTIANILNADFLEKRLMRQLWVNALGYNKKEAILFNSVGKDFGYLSNFYIGDIEVDGIIFNCVEQFYQASKAKLALDFDTFTSIMSERDPHLQLRLEKAVKFRDSISGCGLRDWDHSFGRVMIRGLMQKYGETVENGFGDKLLESNGQYLGEATRHPRWAIGVYDKVWAHARKNTYCWTGYNLLGLCLMQVHDWSLVPPGKVSVRIVGSSHVTRYLEHVRKGELADHFGIPDRVHAGFFGLGGLTAGLGFTVR